MISRFAKPLLLSVCAGMLAACSVDKTQPEASAPAAPVEMEATPEATPQAAATPEPTPEDRTRTERVAEHQRRVQELVRQKQLERAQQQAPGTETQYQ